MATLSVVGTPIGNLSDMTERAIETLRSVDLIACEDTRHTKVLLDRYRVSTPVVSYHQHSSLQKIDWLVDQLKMGKNVALVTDAGTPGISDPGGVLVEKVHQFNQEILRNDKSRVEPIQIISVPGPSSLTAALSISGFPADTFLFLGFLPKKKGRQSLLASLTGIDKALGIETVAFFESALRINQTFIDIETAFAKNAEKSGKNRQIEVVFCRELTKKFEESWRGTLEEAIELTRKPYKGEFVVVLHIK